MHSWVFTDNCVPKERDGAAAQGIHTGGGHSIKREQVLKDINSKHPIQGIVSGHHKGSARHCSVSVSGAPAMKTS